MIFSVFWWFFNVNGYVGNKKSTGVGQNYYHKKCFIVSSYKNHFYHFLIRHILFSISSFLCWVYALIPLENLTFKWKFFVSTIWFVLVTMKFWHYRFCLPYIDVVFSKKCCSNFDFATKSKRFHKSIQQRRHVILIVVCLFWSTEEDYFCIFVTQKEILLRASGFLRSNSLMYNCLKLSAKNSCFFGYLIICSWFEMTYMYNQILLKKVLTKPTLQPSLGDLL